MKTQFQVHLLAVALFLAPVSSSYGQQSANTNTNRQEKVTDAGTSKKTGEYFEFNGGYLNDFLDEIAAYYGIDLRKTATIPQHMIYGVRVPKMRFKKRENENFTAALTLYNQISEEGADKLGKWIITRQTYYEDGRTKQDPMPSAIVLIERSPGSTNSSPVSVRAFALKGITSDELEKLKQVVQTEQDRAREIFARSGGENLSPEAMSGYLNYHEGTGILVALGSKGYVELAGAVIEAYKAQPKDISLITPSSKP
jgi:hypothetical protein